MPFSQEDFNRDNAQRLSVIIMKKMEKPLLMPFKELQPSQQKKFNRLMNEYIQSLPDDWQPKLFADFDQIVNEDLLNEDFDPSATFVPMINTDIETI